MGLSLTASAWPRYFGCSNDKWSSLRSMPAGMKAARQRPCASVFTLTSSRTKSSRPRLGPISREPQLDPFDRSTFLVADHAADG